MNSRQHPDLPLAMTAMPVTWGLAVAAYPVLHSPCASNALCRTDTRWCVGSVRDHGTPPHTPHHPTPHNGSTCIRREGTSEAAPAAVRQAVAGGCQSGWGRLLSVTNAIEAGTWRQGDSGWA